MKNRIGNETTDPPAADRKHGKILWALKKKDCLIIDYKKHFCELCG
jgi:hypothetical protein